MITENRSIRVLAENTVVPGGLLGEHGLSFYMEWGDRRILFDTGAGEVLGHNAKQLDIDLNAIDTIVLSHGHYDHTGGLLEVLERSPHATVYMHPAATENKYAMTGENTSRYIGMPEKVRQELACGKYNGVTTEKSTEIAPGLFVTGPIPRKTDYEDTGGHFFLDEQGEQPDPMADDQALFFFTPEGVVVLSGCAHAGLINTLRYVYEISGHKQIHTVCGGTHLVNASGERMESTIRALKRFNLTSLRPAHCTGLPAMAALFTEFTSIFGPCCTGTEILA